MLSTKALELNAQGINCPLAIETSGHAAMKENYFSWMYRAHTFAQRLLKRLKCAKRAKSLTSLPAALKEPG